MIKQEYIVVLVVLVFFVRPQKLWQKEQPYALSSSVYVIKNAVGVPNTATHQKNNTVCLNHLFQIIAQ